jgi:hypothetical protein
MSYFSSDDNIRDGNSGDYSDEYEKQRARKEKDRYLLETVKLLNEGCINALKYTDFNKQRKDDVEVHTWDIDDIDYDVDECRTYCIIVNKYDSSYYERNLCSVCKKILRQRIELPFTKSKSEVIYDMMLLQEKMKNVLERLSKLEANTNEPSNEQLSNETPNEKS